MTDEAVREDRVPVTDRITVLLADDHALVRRGFRRILEDDAVFCGNTESFRRDLKHLRVGLSTSRVFHFHDDRKELASVRQFQNKIEIGPRSAGSDRLSPAVGSQRIEQFPHAGQQADAGISGRLPIELFLAFADLGDSGLVGIGVKKCANNLRIAPAERRREVCLRERIVPFARDHGPRLKMQRRRVHQRAVHVPNDAVR